MEEEARFWETVVEGMSGEEIGADRRGRVLHFEPYEGRDEVCAVCGETTGGQHVTYVAPDEGGYTVCTGCHE